MISLPASTTSTSPHVQQQIGKCQEDKGTAALTSTNINTVPYSSSKNYPALDNASASSASHAVPFERILPASYPMHHLSKFSFSVEDRNHMCIECALVMLDNSNEQATTLGAAVKRVHSHLSEVAYKQMVLRYPLFGSVPNYEFTEFQAVPVDMDEHIRHVICGEVYQDRHAHMDAQDDNKGTLKHYLQELMNSEEPLKVHTETTQQAAADEEERYEHEQFSKTIASWINIPFRSHVPLWEILVIHNYSKGLALLFRIHHCLGDGTTLANVFKDLCENEPLLENPQLQVLKHAAAHGKNSNSNKNTSSNRNNNNNTDSTTKNSNSSQETDLQSLRAPRMRNVSEIASWIWFHAIQQTVWLNLKNASIQVFALVKTIFMLFITSVVWCVDILTGKDIDSVIKTGRSTAEKNIAWTSSISFDDATSISKYYGVTINDLLVSCFSAGMSRYIDAHHHRYTEQCIHQEQTRIQQEQAEQLHEMQQHHIPGSSSSFEKFQQFQRQMRNVVIGHSDYFNCFSTNRHKPTNFRISIPVNIRSDPFKVNVFVPNEIGFMIGNIPLVKGSRSSAAHSDLISAKLRLKLVQKSMTWAKSLAQPLLSNLISISSQYMPSWLVYSLFSYLASFNSVALTNVRGTPSQLHLLNYPVTDMIGFNPSPTGIELSCLLMSYNGKISFSIVSDKENVKDPEEMLKYFLEEFQTLKSGVGVEPMPKRREYNCNKI